MQLAGGKQLKRGRFLPYSVFPKFPREIKLAKMEFILADAQISFRFQSLGPKSGKTIVVLGGISANCDVFQTLDGNPGWWSWLVGPGRVVDTTQFRVVSFDYLSGALPSPYVSTFDQARFLRQLMERLEIDRIDHFLGASYGGMVGLAFASLFPEKIKHLVSISAAHKSSPFSIGLRTVQRKIFEALKESKPELGLSLARSLAMLSYRTGKELNTRFEGRPIKENDPDSFPIWSYLSHQGNKYVQTMKPDHFLSLSRSIDHHFVDPLLIRTPLTVLACNQDQLVPVEYCQELVAQSLGPSEVLTFDSIYGHDAFLKEEKQITTFVRNVIRRS